jgi:hypothetical protein
VCEACLYDYDTYMPPNAKAALGSWNTEDFINLTNIELISVLQLMYS